MAAQVERDDAELVGQRALVLFLPTRISLRPAVDQQQWPTARLTPLEHIKLETAATLDPMLSLHASLPAADIRSLLVLAAPANARIGSRPAL